MLPHSKDGRLVAPRQDWKYTDVSQWTLALPGPRIVHVQRRITSGQDAAEERKSATDDGDPVPTYFMSPSSSDPIVSMTRTCRESRFVATQQYSLLFPASATWFSFARDFLHLDFGLSPHVVPYGIQDFTNWIPHQPLWPGNPTRAPARFKARRFLRPRFDEQLLARVRNVVVNDEIYISMHRAMQATLAPDWSRAISIMNVFRGLEVYVIADQLFNICHEDGEELVWIRGQLGDELSSLSLSREYQWGT